MQDAIEDHHASGGSIADIARVHGVGYDALRRRLNGEIKIDAITGRVQGLQPGEEQALVEVSVEMSEVGLGLTRQMVKDAALYLVSERANSFGEDGPSDKWFRQFIGRHPELSMRTPEKLSSVRMASSTPEVMEKHFDRLEALVEEHHYSVSEIWNADETSGCILGKELKVLAPKGSSRVVSRSTEGGVTTTLMVAVSADGEKMPPFFIFQGKYLLSGLLQHAPAGSLSAVQESGWMTQELFTEWLKRFVSFVRSKTKRQVLLVVDGHKSRVNLTTALFAKENGVDLLLIPPHTSHILQPLDVSVFKGFKASYRASIKQHHAKKRGPITRNDIAQLTCGPFESITKEAIISGFRATGICPVSREVVLGKLEPRMAIPKEKKVCAKASTMEERMRFLEYSVGMERLKRKALEDRVRELEEKEPTKRRRVNGDSLILTNQETINILAKEDEEKKLKEEHLERKKEEAQARKEQLAKEKEITKANNYVVKWNSISNKADSLSKTLVDAGKTTQKNVLTFLKTLDSVGDLEDMPPVSASFFFFLFFLTPTTTSPPSSFFRSGSLR